MRGWLFKLFGATTELRKVGITTRSGVLGTGQTRLVMSVASVNFLFTHKC